MEIPDATRELQKAFPFITATFKQGDTLYFEGQFTDSDGKARKFLMSKKGDQWIITIDGVYTVASFGAQLPDEIVTAMMDIKFGHKVQPNALALQLQALTKQ